MYDGDNHFPHDGKQGRCGCGEGYSWDDNNSSMHSGSSSSGGGGNGTAIFLIAVVVCSIIGVFNELLGALILIIVGFFLFMSR
ncbi:hypothetical protein KQI22_12725 [Kineothrix sp. MSJ-39]|uniref:hypothetical protein n=1 Tax=Kineothrix sp. MSJ-39 TaxID=2841533 RepID=UPI001C11F185|nr:hypothetical protein [Kineothrix sp. MSJ-39]MBU5430913.1 hypothetical protein [Kineothrix sp. MSJ-39]